MIKNKLIILFGNLLPKISRQKLKAYSIKKKSICIVEEAYDFEINEPPQKISQSRFLGITGTRKVDCFFGLYIDDIRLIGPYGIPVTRKGQIILEPLSPRFFKYFFLETIKTIGFKKFLIEYFLAIFPIFDDKNNKIKIGAHLICRGYRKTELGLNPVFGHWMGEQLPQLRGIEAVSKKLDQKVKLVVNRNPHIWQLESLEMMGYNKSDIIELKRPGTRVERCVLASLRNVNSRNMEFDPKARRWAAQRLQKYIKIKNLKNNVKNKNICLFRQETDRFITNLESVKKIIEKKNFFEIKLQNYPNLFESTKNFFYAQNYFTCFGGGIFRIMFMDNPGTLIEIFSPNEISRPVFFLLANEFGMEYKCIPADIVSNKENKSNNISHLKTNFIKWKVDVNFLRQEFENKDMLL